MVSKLEAAMNKGVKIPIKKGQIILYLGASHGVTPKIVSKIVGKEGFIFCLEVSLEVAKKLLEVCEKHKNMAPLIFDAKYPEKYKDRITKVDLIYQDITQKDQVEIFLKNIAMFLKKKGYCIIIIKTRSINSIKNKEEVLKSVKHKLEKSLNILSITDLHPYHKDHYFIVCQRK